MKTIDASRRAKGLNEILDQARDQDVLVRAADGTEFLLTPIDDFEEEVAKTRRNRKLMAFLQERAKDTETVSFEEVKRRIRLASRKKKEVAGRRDGPRNR